MTLVNPQPKLTPLLPQLARLHTIILRPTAGYLSPYPSDESESSKAKIRQARKFLLGLIPTASPTLSTIVLSLRTRMQLVLYRTETRPTHRAAAKKQQKNECTSWEMVEIGWDQSIGTFVPDVRLYNQREQRVPGDVEKIRIWWEKLAAPAP